MFKKLALRLFKAMLVDAINKEFDKEIQNLRASMKSKAAAALENVKIEIIKRIEE